MLFLSFCDIIWEPIGGVVVKVLSGMSLEELETFQEVVSQYPTIEELKHDLDIIISYKEEEKIKSLNSRFDMDLFLKLQIFDPWELEVIRFNHIENLQQLIDCNLDELVGITPSIKRGLEWVRTFYDMSKMDYPTKKKKR